MTEQFSDDDAAALYDVINQWGASDEYYLGLVMDASSVLDVGCGTGTLLRRARETGHSGRLCGVDPDEAALKVARRGEDIEWVAGVAATMTFSQEFELAVMTGHAFQCLITDDDVRTSLAAIRRALSNGGRFAFETRNPTARAWETWRPENASDVIDPSGRELRIRHNVEDVSDDIVTLTETTAEPGGAPLRVDRAALRFLTVEAVEAFLKEAGFRLEATFGGWSREPLAPASPEIVVIAASAPAQGAHKAPR